MDYKVSRSEQERSLKDIESENFARKRQQYLSDIEENREHKSKEKNFLAYQYDEMINNRKERD